MTNMKNKLNSKSPVVVGGVGGSGTRLIADILMELGYYIGSDLNKSLDNLAVTLLFKRPRWYKKKIACIESHVRRGLNILTRAMTEQKTMVLNPAEIHYFLNAVLDMYRYGSEL
jgi:RNase adaptor protein for sRNA GlmZ degradation